MGNIVGKLFRVVASKNVTDSLADSIKNGNQAKFYLAQDKLPNGQALDDVTSPNELTDRNVLIINGNKIQGVNQNDLSKLDSITDASKLFKYKGSVATIDELLKKVPPEAEVGDVWNMEQECEIDGVKYPAYTNFVCSSIKVSIGGKPASSTWDSLGGTMQMGTVATVNSMGNTRLDYHTSYDIPISAFSINLAVNSSLKIANGEITLSKSSPSAKKIDRETLYYGSNDPIANFKIKVDVAQGLYINDLNMISLSISTKGGLGIDTNDSLYMVLSTDKSIPIDKGVSAPENSGLAFNSNGALTIAIGENYSNNNDCINGALVLGSGTNGRHGGLCISSKVVVDFINTNMNIRTYINSLIDAKLKAQ